MQPWRAKKPQNWRREALRREQRFGQGFGRKAKPLLWNLSVEEGRLGRLQTPQERPEEGAALASGVLTDLSSWSTSALLCCVHQPLKGPLRLSLPTCKTGTP